MATGGLSYQSTGSTGDGFRFAESLGHTVTECMPALVPMECKEDWVPELQGLSLRNVNVTICDGKKKAVRRFRRNVIYALWCERTADLKCEQLCRKETESKRTTLKIDLKPALSEEQLDHRVLREFEENQNRQFKNAVHKLFPSKLIPVMIELSGIDPEKKVNVITKEERLGFVRLIKNLECTLTGLRDYNEAIITKGGIKIKEVDPGTMESRLVKGLHFAGEVLDLDAVTGGFNLQIAWSTAYAAGTGIESADE